MANVLKIPSRLSKAGGRNYNYKLMTTSGYYSPPKDCIVRVHVFGAGGGGSGGGPTLTSGGGAGGTYVMKTLRMKAGYAYNVTLGAGGTGGSGGNGGAGGTTSVEGVDIDGIYAYGGGGGRASSPSEPYAYYGARGTGAGGDVVQPGQGRDVTPGGAVTSSASGYAGTRFTNPSSHPNSTALNGTSFTLFTAGDYFGLYYGGGGSAGGFVSVPNPWNPQAPGYFQDGFTGQPGAVIFEEIL